MKINSSKLYLKDVNLYDISSCHYKILEGLNLDISHIDKNDKEKRNIQIGIMMRDNPSLTQILRKTTISTIDSYIRENELTEDDIILRQYDGFLTQRTLSKTNLAYLTIDLQAKYLSFLISLNRDMYIAGDGTNVVVKGVPNRYPEIDKFYQKLIKINFLNISSIFKSLHKIKTEFFENDNPNLFCIPQDDKFTVYIKHFGQVEIDSKLVKLMDTNDIDKRKYFYYYLKPFIDSICLEFL